MAHKSKTQRAKASAAKANKKERQEREAIASENVEAAVEETAEESKGGLFKKKEAKPEAKQQTAAAVKKEEKKPKKKRFQFFRDVKAEMKRVTWPSRTDVVRWSGVVVGALVFFGVYVALLDNVIVTPALVALSGLGA
ncbi:MAG: preprotein translocase subunit SecE [Eggerthellaceae bacterium]|nr:preprotein translocase subunit SecE [Eggerthellaceae bacterium]